MAFKKATVDSGSVAATLTDYPSYVDLSRVGITTLAEAQSVRVYSDEAKTTELAREIVSASEMHVKIPSLTTTTEIYIDYDGVRSDYAVSATYGRNTVWSDYEAVYHMESDASDSSGNYSAGTISGAANGVMKIGNGYDFDGISDQINFGRLSGIEGVSTLTQQAWHSSDLGTDMFLWGNTLGAASSATQAYYESNPVVIFFSVESINNRMVYPVSEMTANQQHMLHLVFDGGLSGNANRYKIYQDGNDNTAAASFVGTIETAIGTRTDPHIIGLRPGATTFDLDGTFDEYRFRTSALSANWIETEYNNQNDESTFWGTWSEVSATNTSNFLIFF